MSNSVGWLLNEKMLSLSLREGWNLISLPVSGMLSNYSNIIYYMDNKWVMNISNGFWVNMPKAEQIIIPVKPNSIAIKQGMNLIGSLENTSLKKFFNSSNTYFVMGYNGTWQAYNPSNPASTLDRMIPGYGYFVKAKMDFNITI